MARLRDFKARDDKFWRAPGFSSGQYTVPQCISDMQNDMP
jgi:hypothetical protein